MENKPLSIKEIETFNLWGLLLNFILSLESEFKKALEQQLPGVEIKSRVTDTNKFIKNRKIGEDLGTALGLVEIYFSVKGGKSMRIAIYDGRTQQAHIELVKNSDAFYVLKRETKRPSLFDPNQIEMAAHWIKKGELTKFGEQNYNIT